MQAAYNIEEEKPFAASQNRLEELISKLQSPEAMTLEHSELEELVKQEGFEVLRLLIQDQLDLRAHTERDVREDEPVVGVDGAERTHRRQTSRKLETIFGEVTVSRAGYGGRGTSSVYPLDAELNLPAEKYSHGTRRVTALEVAKNSYDDTVETTRMTIRSRRSTQ